MTHGRVAAQDELLGVGRSSLRRKILLALCHTCLEYVDFLFVTIPLARHFQTGFFCTLSQPGFVGVILPLATIFGIILAVTPPPVNITRTPNHIVTRIGLYSRLGAIDCIGIRCGTLALLITLEPQCFFCASVECRFFQPVTFFCPQRGIIFGALNAQVFVRVEWTTRYFYPVYSQRIAFAFVPF
ncbi:MAG TPA: hypothetical protein PKW28_08945 [Turneriella sp.]|nr:hypothetical protein [Turneriella sp.]HNJ66008.1 hypothetical protein [Turneriella sp.]HNL53697.1 hypothetical protein [Turneriella sp.]